jgi:hypothetical protein
MDSGVIGSSVIERSILVLKHPFRAFTRPDVPPVAYPEGFQGNEIPIDGALVARLCVERLSLSEEADD